MENLIVQSENGVTKIKEGTYRGLQAAIILTEISKLVGQGMLKVLVAVLQHNTYEDLKITVKEYIRFSDCSGHFVGIIEHFSCPEGLKIEVNTKLDIHIKIYQWGYEG